MMDSDAAALEPVAWRVRPGDPGAHCFDVVLSVPAPTGEGQLLALPAWIPGSYLIRDFARNVVEIRASAAGRPVSIEKIDKSTWRCAPCDGPLEVGYRVYAYDLSVRGAYLDTTRGFFNGTNLLLRVLGREHAPCRLTLERPEGADFEHWRVATGMPAEQVDAEASGPIAPRTTTS
jgi:predicted metalloprotease with PDZ domain